MAPPDPHPLPPTDFPSRDIPIELVAAGRTFQRIHRSDFGALYFGTTGANRFDDPQGLYGVCYVADTMEGAFAETCLRDLGAQFVALAFLAIRSGTRLETIGALRLVPVHGPALARLGATSAVSGGDHRIARIWSRAIHDHPAAPDGLLYRANHDNGEICAALFARCRDRLKPGATAPLLADRPRLAALVDRYKVGIG